MTGARTLICLVAGIGAACGREPAGPDVSGAAQPIVNGALAAACEWPAVVWLDPSCTGVLVHPRLVLYAGHCGGRFARVVFGSDIQHPDRVQDVASCEIHPGAGSFGEGNDVGYCLLTDDVGDVPIVPVAADCEVSRLTAPFRATVVGFGASVEGGPHGQKRFADLQVADDGAEYRAEDGVICAGDSGGPLYARIPSTAGPASGAWRVVGISSSSPTEPCVTQPAFFTRATRFASWAAERTGLRLSPCVNEAGQWQPSPRCRDVESTAGDACAWTEAPSETCGPRAQWLDPQVPPSLIVTAPADNAVLVLAAGETHATVNAEVMVADRGGGIGRVQLTVLTPTGRTVADQITERAPFALTPVRVPEGTWRFHFEGSDNFQNRTSAEVRLRVVETQQRGCTVASAGRSDPFSTLLAVLGLVRLARRRVSVPSPRPAR